MKTLQMMIVAVLLVYLTACASTYHFPVSNIVPAADISVQIEQDDNNNYNIELTAKNLAAPDRLSPPREKYNVWIKTDSGSIKNLGQLLIDNAEKGVFETSTPYTVKEIFITAEDNPNTSIPSGVEISRLKIE